VPSPTLLSLSTTYEHITNLASYRRGCDSPSEKLEALLRCLAQVRGSLTKREREILNLRFDRDLSLQEIARLTGVTRQRVHQIINRAIQKLKRLLSDLTSEDL
jgi:RNA polymerase sigma factor (sigma-70 family)